MSLKPSKNEVFTIPNILSFFRILLIPLIVVLYCKYKMYGWTTVVILVSGFTDVLDGWIARKYHMISDFGKLLDPVADKLTQAAVALSLCMRFPYMFYLFILMFIKEMMVGISGLLGVRQSGEVHGAEWHGKLTTCVIYATLLLHIVWYDITKTVSNISLLVAAIVMVYSLTRYVMKNMRIIKEGR